MIVEMVGGIAMAVVTLEEYHKLEAVEARYESATQELEAAIERVHELEDTLLEIEYWCRAYPLSVFPEPDFKHARKLLSDGGMSLDVISASNMRHVVNGVRQIIEERLGRKDNLDSGGD